MKNKSPIPALGVLTLLGVAAALTTKAGNIALNKPVIAGSSYASYLPANIVDGNLDTYWNGGTWGSPGSSCWIKVDLETVVNLQRVVLWRPMGSDIYEVFGSLDDINWTPLATAIVSTTAGSSVLNTHGQPYRYLRCDVVGGADWSAIAEIEAFPAVEISVATRTPATIQLTLKNCLSDMTNTIERSADPSDPSSWVTVATLTEITDSILWEDTLSSSSERAFYRVRSE